MSTTLYLAYAAVLGLAIGSFLNVAIHRLPEGLSVVRPRSRCPSCQQPIAWYDNVPVASWVALRGRCRHCRVAISVQYPVVELATALIWLAAAARFGFSVEALRSALFLTLLLGIALTDAKHMIIPDHFSLGGLAAGLLLAAASPDFPLARAAVGAVAAYLLLWGIALGGQRLFRKPALGVGDIHMMAMIGAFLGLAGALMTILFGSVLALAIGVPYTWLRGRLKLLGTYLPLGTFLAMGAAVAHVWGEIILDWYLHVFVGMP
jgi:leader peptidase (prepilin peptidase) / N-methyltransferase